MLKSSAKRFADNELIVMVMLLMGSKIRVTESDDPCEILFSRAKVLESKFAILTMHFLDERKFFRWFSMFPLEIILFKIFRIRNLQTVLYAFMMSRHIIPRYCLDSNIF